MKFLYCWVRYLMMIVEEEPSYIKYDTINETELLVVGTQTVDWLEKNMI